MRRRYKSNPAWVDEIVNRHWKAIEKHVGKKRMPVATAGVMAEYGCGAYGCVLPTHDSGVVLKLTTDLSEAAFAAAAIDIARDDGGFPAGMVAYYGSLALSEKFKGKPVYLLWRQEAFFVGEIVAFTDAWARIARLAPRPEFYKQMYGVKTIDRFGAVLNAFQLAALDIFDAVDTKTNDAERVELLSGVRELLHSDTRRRTTEEAIVIALRVDDLAERAAEMQEQNFGREVGEALEYYLHRGIVLADVHGGNVGDLEADVDGPARLVITDPGMMVPVDPSWLAVDIPLVA